MLCLDSFFYFVHISILYIWFVVIRFWYHSLYIFKIILSFWSFHFKCISYILHLYFLLTVVGFDIFVCGWFPTFAVCVPLLVNFSIHNVLVSSCSFSFSAETSFHICCKADLVLLNSPSICLFVKFLIFLSNLKERLATYSWL